MDPVEKRLERFDGGVKRQGRRDGRGWGRERKGDSSGTRTIPRGFTEAEVALS